MRLRKIRLAGFKSFVDPTTIELPGDLIAVVGPNGCGKSNIIDAVRWVMGEISAKHLRGDTMADVVFTGSSARKPVGQASVELVFDNTDGSLGGRFAAYPEISVRRQVTRDSQSLYFLNGARCRRRDVMDVFLGTGLGPRSYAIIEQGMISRLIEARPEELREFLEEAAGISKYKERRRETENRIRHTRENLDRLEDLREELGRQLAHLERQARQAEKYKELKARERRLRAEMLALRWRSLDADASRHEARVREQATALEAAVAEQRRLEADLERARAAHHADTESFNEAYRAVLEAGAEIARTEEAIEGHRERARHLDEAVAAERASLERAREAMRRDEREEGELAAALAEAEPELERLQHEAAEARVALRNCEEAMHAWQAEWEDLTARAAEPAQAAHAEEARIQQMERNRAALAARREQLREEAQGLDPEPLERAVREGREALAAAEARLAEAERRVVRRREAIGRLREERDECAATLDHARQRYQEIRGRLASLRALQEAALGMTAEGPVAWLRERGLEERPRLAQVVEVEPGWEGAVELVLAQRLEAVCVPALDEHAPALASRRVGPLTLVEAGPDPAPAVPLAAGDGSERLADRVRGPGAVAELLAGVYTAPDPETALARRAGLAPTESVVTPDGLWLGARWSHRPAPEEGDGVLAREREIESLMREHASLEDEGRARAAALGECEARLREAEDLLAEAQGELGECHRERAERASVLGAGEARLEELRARRAAVAAELADLEARLEAESRVLETARERLRRSAEEVDRLSGEREAWSRQRERHRERLEQARERWHAVRDRAYELGLRIESMRSRLRALREGRERAREQVAALERRSAELERERGAVDAPAAEAERRLGALLERRAGLDAALRAARERVEGDETRIAELERARSGRAERAAAERERLEALRLEGQEIVVRRRTVEEHLAEDGLRAAELLDELPADAEEGRWEEQLTAVERRIARLGPINLAAIDEHAQQAERKHYLDAQHADLVEALETLQEAIRKIDRETRARFKETYEKVNAGLAATFPRLFGGGQASLQLTGEDLLDTGVSVMARPPGKRNTSIALLSGGEKALTAVALVFAIFELNPAPFCLLDEVDAPLDDANVGRFCELVKEMSERLQFLVVTHNKLTMEIAEQLIGVTMNEPGVSRLVAVDIDEAVELAAV